MNARMRSSSRNIVYPPSTASHDPLLRLSPLFTGHRNHSLRRIFSSPSPSFAIMISSSSPENRPRIDHHRSILDADQHGRAPRAQKRGKRSARPAGRVICTTTVRKGFMGKLPPPIEDSDSSIATIELSRARLPETRRDPPGPLPHRLHRFGDHPQRREPPRNGRSSIAAAPARAPPASACRAAAPGKDDSPSSP